MATHGIRENTRWRGPDGRVVRVVYATERYVRTEDVEGLPAPSIYYLRFLEAFAPCDEHAKLRRTFVALLCVRREFTAYWRPSEGRVILRKINAAKRHALPPDAVLIGRYAHPFSGDQFVADLEAVIAKIEHENRVRAE